MSAKPRHRGRPRNACGMTVAELRAHVVRHGSRRALARALGVDRTTVRAWLAGERHVSPEVATRIGALLPARRPRRGRPRTARAMGPLTLAHAVSALGGPTLAASSLGICTRTLRRYARAERHVPPLVVARLRALVALALENPHDPDSSSTRKRRPARAHRADSRPRHPPAAGAQAWLAAPVPVAAAAATAAVELSCLIRPPERPCDATG